MMTRIALALCILLVPSAAMARGLKVGDKATNFNLKDSQGKAYTLNSFKTNVLVVWYEGKNSKEQNRWIKNKLKRFRKAGKLSTATYTSIGIANFQETAVPNFIINMVIKSEIKKTGSIILCDRTGMMMKHWGFRNGRSNIYVFDKQRRLRWKTSGPLSKKIGNRLIRMIRRLQR
jgi:predicted transcriptional regulator